jgi:hypothetical protein
MRPEATLQKLLRHILPLPINFIHHPSRRLNANNNQNPLPKAPPIHQRLTQHTHMSTQVFLQHRFQSTQLACQFPYTRIDPGGRTMAFGDLSMELGEGG